MAPPIANVEMVRLLRRWAEAASDADHSTQQTQTFRRAAASLAAHPTRVTSEAEALKVKFVGAKLSTLLGQWLAFEDEKTREPIRRIASLRHDEDGKWWSISLCGCMVRRSWGKWIATGNRPGFDSWETLSSPEDALAWAVEKARKQLNKGYSHVEESHALYDAAMSEVPLRAVLRASRKRPAYPANSTADICLAGTSHSAIDSNAANSGPTVALAHNGLPITHGEVPSNEASLDDGDLGHATYRPRVRAYKPKLLDAHGAVSAHAAILVALHRAAEAGQEPLSVAELTALAQPLCPTVHLETRAISSIGGGRGWGTCGRGGVRGGRKLQLGAIRGALATMVKNDLILCETRGRTHMYALSSSTGPNAPSTQLCGRELGRLLAAEIVKHMSDTAADEVVAATVSQLPAGSMESCTIQRDRPIHPPSKGDVNTTTLEVPMRVYESACRLGEVDGKNSSIGVDCCSETLVDASSGAIDVQPDTDVELSAKDCRRNVLSDQILPRVRHQLNVSTTINPSPISPSITTHGEYSMRENGYLLNQASLPSREQSPIGSLQLLGSPSHRILQPSPEPRETQVEGSPPFVVPPKRLRPDLSGQDATMSCEYATGNEHVTDHAINERMAVTRPLVPPEYVIVQDEETTRAHCQLPTSAMQPLPLLSSHELLVVVDSREKLSRSCLADAICDTLGQYVRRHGASVTKKALPVGDFLIVAMPRAITAHARAHDMSTATALAAVEDLGQARGRGRGENRQGCGRMGSTASGRSAADVSVALEFPDSAWEEALVLDTVVERKVVDDFLTTIRDARHFTSQKVRLRRCGLARPFYLVEGSIERWAHLGERNRMKLELARIEVVDGLLVHRSRSTADTMSFLSAAVARVARAAGSKTPARMQEDGALCTYTLFCARTQPARPRSAEFGAMLLSIDGMTAPKIENVLSRYPTARAVSEAIEDHIAKCRAAGSAPGAKEEGWLFEHIIETGHSRKALSQKLTAFFAAWDYEEGNAQIPLLSSRTRQAWPHPD